MVQQSKQVARRKPQHLYLNCRDSFSVPSVGSIQNGALLLSSDANGAVSFGVVLNPMGLTAATLSASAWNQGVAGNVMAPQFRGLYNKAIDFQWYRITRAKFVFVAVTSSNTTGQATLAGYSDPMDIANTTFGGNISGPNTKSFTLSSGSTREFSVPVPVDTSWKKVSSVLTYPAGAFPFVGNSTTTLVTVASVADLSFGAVSLRVTGAPASSALGSLYLDYDVEFKGPVDPYVNL